MKNNKGFSLVELLVTIAIASVIVGSVGYLLITSMRMYGNGMTDISMQQEVRTAYNLIDSYVKEAQFIAIGNYDDAADGSVGTNNCEAKTKYLALGTFEKKNHENREYVNYKFSGVLIVADENVLTSDYVDGNEPVKGNIYMKTYKDEVIDSTGTPSHNLSKPANLANEVKEILKEENRKKYLLASNVQNFYVIPENMAPNDSSNVIPGVCNDPHEATDKGYSFWMDTEYRASEGATCYYYNNNISLKVKLIVAKKGSGRVDTKKMNESIVIRNYMTDDILLNGLKYKEVHNSRAAVEIETETVQMEKKLGYIETVGGAGSFNILEIVPDYSCDYFQFSIGGKNGECFDFDNVTYGNPNFDRMTPTQFMDYINKNYNQYNSPYIYQNGNELKTLVPVYDYNEGKWNIINNELVKLYFLQDEIEAASGKTIYPSMGIWDESAKKYYEPNYSALKAWEASHSLTLNVCVPGDLRNNPDFIKNADMIIVATPADEGFKTATTWYNNVKGTDRTADTYAGGDITFDEAKAIFTKVVDNETSIACPSALSSDTGRPNLNALFKMLYWVRNKEITGADDGTYNYNYNSNISNGSGRDAFRSVTRFEQVDEYLKMLESIKYNSQYVLPDEYSFLYSYDYNGAAFQTVYKNQLIYNNMSTLLTFSSGGGYGLLGLSKANKGATNKVPKGTTECFGEIYFVGAGLREDDFDAADITKSYATSGANFSVRVETVKKDVPESGEIEYDKYIYLTDPELAYVKDNGLYLYSLLNFTDETLTEQAESDVKVGEEGTIYRIRDREADYAPDGTVKGKAVKKTVLYSYKIDKDEFADLEIGKYDNNEIILESSISVGGRKAIGDDKVYIIVRDLFDLD